MAMTGGTAVKVKSVTPSGWPGAVALYVYYKTAQDITTNKSTITCGMYVTTPDGWDIGTWNDFNGSYVGKTSNTFDGTIPNFSGTRWIAENKTFTVSHNADGTGTATIYWKWGVNTVSSFGYHNPSGSFSITLPTIPRASTVTAAAGTIGSALRIAISRASSSFKHTLKYSFGDGSGTIVTETTSTSYSWTPPMSLCKQIPSATSGTCTITCDTYSGDTKIGSDTCTMKLTVPSSVKPTCASGWCTIAPYNTGTAAAGLDAYVKGYSKAQVSFDSSKIDLDSAYGATISYYKIVHSGKTDSASPYRTGTLTTSGTHSVACYVYDSRGRYVKTSLSITVYNYAAPSLTGISAYRCNSSGTAADDGTYIYVKASTIYYTLGGENTITLRTRYKAASGSYSSYTTLTSGTGKVLGSGQILTTSTYIVEIEATDDMGKTATFTAYIPTAAVFFHGMDGGGAAAFGKFAELDNTLDVGWDLMVRGNVYGRMRALGKIDWITTNEDFNTYTNFGEYSVQSNATAETIANIPIARAGKLTVSSGNGTGKNTGSWAYVLQEYATYDGQYYFYRLCETDADGEWQFNDWSGSVNDTGWISLGLSSNVTEDAGTGRNGVGCFYRVINGNHVYVAFCAGFTFAGEAIRVNETSIPTEYRPSLKAYTINTIGGYRIARTGVNSSGNVIIDWAQDLNTGETTATTPATWIDGYIDYWI